MVYSNEFLKTFTQDLNKKMGTSCSFDVLKNFVNSKSYRNHTAYDYKETQDYLILVKNILDKITAIAFNPHINATTEDVIVRSEIATSLSSQSFKETLNDSKLWKSKNGVMSPEFVHTKQYIDTVVTYENTFITRLIDLIYDEMDKLKDNLSPLVKSLEEEYENKGITYGKYSMLNEFKVGEPIKKEGLAKEASSETVVALIEKNIKRIKHLRTTELYRFNIKNRIESQIKPTNILIHDQLYSYCYRFYLSNYFVGNNNENEQQNVGYYNYFVTLLLAYLKDDVKADTKLSFKNGAINFKDIIIKKGLYTYTFSSDVDNLGVRVTSTLNFSKTIQASANYYLLMSYQYNYSNQPIIDERINKLSDEYDDVILIAQNSKHVENKNILNISIYNAENDLLIKNLLASMAMLFEVDDNIYESICPVCGQKYLNIDKNQYECSSCHSHYQLFKNKTKTLLWVKSLRRDK